MEDLAHVLCSPDLDAAEVTVAPCRDYLLVTLCGTVDTGVADELRDVLVRAAHDPGPVVVDASRLAFCDGTVVSFLATLADLCPVTVDRPSRLVRETFTAFRLTERVRVRRPR